MKFSNQYISKFTDSFLKKQDKFQSLKELGNKKSIPYQIDRCKERLSEDYKFWMVKQDSELKTNKLASIQRVINSIKKLESKTTYSPEDIKILNDIVERYRL